MDRQELAELLGRIEAVEQGLEKDMEQQGEAQAELREAETRVMQLRRAAAELEGEMETSRAEQSRLEDDLQRHGEALRAARQALGTAMRRAWRTGRQDNLRTILGGGSAGEVDRRLTWAGFLVSVWAQRAGDAAKLAGEVRGLRDRSAGAERKLAGLRERRAQRLDDMERALERRRSALRGLNARIGEAGEEMNRLKRRAATLASLVEDLGAIVQDHQSPPLPSITAARGQLGWPLRGRILQRFGAGPADVQASWDGILLEAQEGAPVHAPHPGRVVFADWVRGLGFLMVLDHGENVLSLYAYNDRLLGAKGEMVNKGQVIAHAGSTGGRREPGLYFEIRWNGEPVDPVQWLSK